MIVVDSSAIIALLEDEPPAPAFAHGSQWTPNG
jgi:uncharacterized protein with PIN domain